MKNFFVTLFVMLATGFVDKIFAFVVPKIIGGSNALTAVEGTGFEKLFDAVNPENFSAQKIGADFLLSGYVREAST